MVPLLSPPLADFAIRSRAAGVESCNTTVFSSMRAIPRAASPAGRAALLARHPAPCNRARKRPKVARLPGPFLARDRTAKIPQGQSDAARIRAVRRDGHPERERETTYMHRARGGRESLESYPRKKNHGPGRSPAGCRAQTLNVWPDRLCHNQQTTPLCRPALQDRTTYSHQRSRKSIGSFCRGALMRPYVFSLSGRV